jgi:hypothetical protein
MCSTTPPPDMCANLGGDACCATTGCKPVYCTDANGATTFAGCYGPNSGTIPMCMSTPDRCSQFDEQTCKTLDSCQAEYCTDSAGNQTYEGCFTPGTTMPNCNTPPPSTDVCVMYGERDCLARPDLCTAAYCETASGTKTFNGCYGRNSMAPTCPR